TRSMAAVSAESRKSGKTPIPARRATVMTTARLHFGFLDPSGRGPEPFGSFGLAIDRPVTRLTLRRANSLKVSGEEAERAAHYLAQLAEAYDLRNSYGLTVEETIPPHSGLGSGTQ